MAKRRESNKRQFNTLNEGAASPIRFFGRFCRSIVVLGAHKKCVVNVLVSEFYLFFSGFLCSFERRKKKRRTNSKGIEIYVRIKWQKPTVVFMFKIGIFLLLLLFLLMIVEAHKNHHSFETRTIESVAIGVDFKKLSFCNKFTSRIVNVVIE